jgi:hypothetical protein
MQPRTTLRHIGKKHSKQANLKIIFELLSMLIGQLIGVGSMPQLKHHEIPNMRTKIAAALLVVGFQQPFECRALEVASLR